MFPLRRAALRILSTPPSSLAFRSRTITSSLSSTLRTQRASAASSQSASILLQRRWASDAAKKEAEDADVPISKLQPTPLEEVENAVEEDQVAKEEAAAEPQESVEIKSRPARGARNAERPIGGAASSPQDSESRFTPRPVLYIGNLFFDVTEDDLTKEFARFGNVEKVRIIRDARGLSKGFGYVTFSDIAGATMAVNGTNQQLFEGRRLSVQYATHPGPPERGSDVPRPPRNPPSKTLFIGNMSWEMTDKDLHNLFRGIKNVIDVRVAIDRRTGQPRGFAHADFIDVKSAMEARELLENKETYGRKLRLDYSYSSSAAPRNQARDEAEPST